MKTRQTVDYEKWFAGLRDKKAAEKIAIRIVRLEAGNFGDHKMFGSIGELRIDFGPGYRVYFGIDGDRIVILVGGGSKKRES